MSDVGAYPIIAINGGTGIRNANTSTITLGGAFAMSGAFTFTGTVTGNTTVTFPTSGTLATTAQLPSLPLSGANGGTGVANTGKTINLGSPVAGYVATSDSSGNLTLQPSTSGGFSSVNVQVITTTGTYTPTANMLFCVIECWGGGAGGGGAPATGSAFFGSAGGGAGGYSRLTASAATIGASQAVTIGSAGSGGAAGANNGADGSATSVGALCIANGGSGGVTGSFANTFAGGSGGTPGTGDIAAPGQAGGASISNVTQADFAGYAGFGGSTSVGSGGYGVGAGSAGVNGSGYGAGGSGALANGLVTALAGGDGTAGYVVITEYIGVAATSTAGTFTPTLFGSSTAGTTTYSIQDGIYVKNGNLVTIWVTLVGSAATGTGFVYFGNFPFTINSDIYYNPVGPLYSQSNAAWAWPTGATQITVTGNAGTTTTAVFACATGGISGVMAMANAAFNFQFTLSYSI